MHRFISSMCMISSHPLAPLKLAPKYPWNKIPDGRKGDGSAITPMSRAAGQLAFLGRALRRKDRGSRQRQVPWQGPAGPICIHPSQDRTRPSGLLRLPPHGRARPIYELISVFLAGFWHSLNQQDYGLFFFFFKEKVRSRLYFHGCSKSLTRGFFSEVRRCRLRDL